MKRGDIVRTKSVKAEFGNAEFRGSATHKAFNGQHMVFLMLGSAKMGEPFDAEAALRRMGWVPASEADRHTAVGTDDL